MISRIGKYTVEAELGRGGFGQVYKAWDPDVRQSVAIKVLLSEGDPGLLKRFHLEVVTTASLHHKNIVTIYASGEEAGTPYLVMELLEGKTLGQIIKQQIPLSLMEKVRIMTQVAEGLEYANSKGVVHRDVKPANIMLLPDGQVKIMDFGIALASNRIGTVTMDGFVVGTVPYMAPEQFTSDSRANELTDIFAFGDVYYELLTGHHPFSESMRDLSALRMAILTRDPKPLSQVVPDCPERLEMLVHRTLAKEVEFRYQTFEELRLDSASVLVDLQHDQAAAILKEVPRLLAIEDLQEARAKVREAQQLEPGNRQARHYLETIDHKLQEKLNRERIAARLAEAENLMAERRFAEAVQSLATAAKLDTSNTVVKIRLLEAKAKLDGSVHANRLVEDARTRQQRGELAEALDRLNRAIEIDPSHTEALRLRPKVNEQLDRHQRDQIRQHAIRSASEHLAGKRYGDALDVLADLEKEQPGSAEVTELRGRIERERAEEDRRLRAERFNLALARTRETMQSGELERAAQMLSHLYSNFSNEPGASEVLPQLSERLKVLVRSRDIALYRQRVNDLLKQKSFREAIDVLAEALAQYPDDSGLIRQKTSAEALYEAYKRSEAIASVLKRANSLRDGGDLRGALAAISEGRRRLGEESGFVDLAHEIETEIDQQRYAAGLKDLLETLRELMAAGKYAEAIDHITWAKDYASEVAVLNVLDAARSAAGKEEEKTFASQALAASVSLRAARNWKSAENTLANAVMQYPQNQELQQALERLRAEWQRERRRVAIDTERAAIQEEIERGAWKKAEAAIRKARQAFPDAAFDELAEQAEAGLREERLNEAAARVRSKLAANNLREAVAELEAARAAFPRDARWKSLEEEIARWRAYEAALEEAEQQRREGNLARAEELLTGVIAAAPDPRATQMFSLIRDQRAEVAAVAESVRAALKRYDIRQAAAELAAARGKYRDESIWGRLQSEIEARQALLRQQSAIADSVREILKRDDFPQARSKLAEGRAKHENEALWANLQAEIDSREAVVARQAAIAATAESVRNCLKRDDLGKAGAELEKARRSYPDGSAWAELEEQIASRRAFLKRQAEIAAAAEGVRDCLKQNDVERAVIQLRDARRAYPNEAPWPDLQKQIEARQALMSRQKQVTALAESVRDRLLRGDMLRAAGELATARSKFPDEAEWVKLQNEIDARQQALDVQAKIAAAGERVRQCLESDDLQQASTDLAAARKLYPKEGAWPTLEKEIEARRKQLDRQAKIAQAAGSIAECLQRNDVRKATAELTAARKAYPAEEVWSSLQTQIEERQSLLDRQAKITAAQGKVRECLERDDVKQATAALAEARKNYPNEDVWAALDAQIAARRQEQISATGMMVLDRLNQGDIPQAMSQLNLARTLHPDEVLWSTLQEQVDAHKQALAQQAEIRAFAGRVRECLRREDAKQARQELAAARARFPDEGEWAALDIEIGALQAVLARRAEIAAIAYRVRECLKRDDLAQAQAELTSARARFANEREWAALDEEIRGRQTDLERQAEVRAIADRVRECLKRGELEKVQAELREARRQFPGEAAWTTFDAEIARQADLERQSEVRAIADRVRECLKRGELEKVQAELREARRQFPGEAAWATFDAEIARRADLERQSDVRAIADRVRECLKRGELEKAQADLREARNRFPKEGEWTALEREIDARQAAIARQREVAAIVTRIEEALQRNDVRQARTELDAGRRKFRDEDAWAGLEAEIRARQSGLERQSQVAEIVARVREALQRDSVQQAQAELDVGRKKFSGEGVWVNLDAEIAESQARLQRQAEMAAIQDRVRACLRRNDVGQARAQLGTARQRFPNEGVWAALDTEIDAWQESQRQGEIAGFSDRVRGSLKCGDVLQARMELAAARQKFPSEGAWAALDTEIERWQQEAKRQAEIAAIAEKVRAPLKRDDLRQAVTELDSARTRYPGEGLWTTLQAEIQARRVALDAIREAQQRAEAVRGVLQQAQALLREEKTEDAVALLRQAAAQYPGESQIAELLRTQEEQLRRQQREREQRERAEREEQQRREARENSRTQLLALERQAAEERDKRKLKKLDAEAQRVAALYTADQEIAAIAGRVHAQVQSALATPAAAKPVPWKLIGGGVGAAAAVLAIIFVPRLFHPRETPVTAIPIEIRTDPPGAAVHVGEHSCITPNCRLDLAPGSYEVEAQLKNYESKRQTLIVDQSSHSVDLTLSPVAPTLPPPRPGQPPPATGTLVVQAGVPDALVSIDGTGRSRTDASGSLTLTLEPSTHQVAVERNGYEKPAARQVKITAGATQTVVFNLAVQNARLELRGAPAGVEISAGGTSLGRTDGSAVYLFPGPVKPGDQSLQVTLGSARRPVPKRFEPGQLVRLEWKDVAPIGTPPPPPANTEETLERQDWGRVSTGASVAQLQAFLGTHPNSPHRKDAEAQIAELNWKAVDQKDIAALRKFVTDTPGNPHRADAQRLIDQLDAEQKRITQERTKQDQLKQDLAKQEQAKLEQAKKDQVRKQQVVDSLSQLDSALQRKRSGDLKSIWPGVSKTFLDTLTDRRFKLSLLCKPEDVRLLPPGDQASVLCDLVVTTGSSAPDHQAMTAILRSIGAAWTVEKLTRN